MHGSVNIFGMLSRDPEATIPALWAGAAPHHREQKNWGVSHDGMPEPCPEGAPFAFKADAHKYSKAELRRKLFNMHNRRRQIFIRSKPLSANATKSVFTDYFNTVDGDGSGTVNLPELLHSMQSASLPCHKKAIQEMMALVDTDGNGEIDWAEFEAFLNKQAASGQDVMGSEFVLPSGKGLPLGPIFNLLRRRKMMVEIMERDSPARVDWINRSKDILKELSTGKSKAQRRLLLAEMRRFQDLKTRSLGKRRTLSKLTSKRSRTPLPFDDLLSARSGPSKTPRTSLCGIRNSIRASRRSRSFRKPTVSMAGSQALPGEDSAPAAILDGMVMHRRSRFGNDAMQACSVNVEPSQFASRTTLDSIAVSEAGESQTDSTSPWEQELLTKRMENLFLQHHSVDNKRCDAPQLGGKAGSWRIRAASASCANVGTVTGAKSPRPDVASGALTETRPRRFLQEDNATRLDMIATRPALATERTMFKSSPPGPRPYTAPPASWQAYTPRTFTEVCPTTTTTTSEMPNKACAQDLGTIWYGTDGETSSRQGEGIELPEFRDSQAPVLYDMPKQAILQRVVSPACASLVLAGVESCRESLQGTTKRQQRVYSHGCLTEKRTSSAAAGKSSARPATAIPCLSTRTSSQLYPSSHSPVSHQTAKQSTPPHRCDRHVSASQAPARPGTAGLLQGRSRAASFLNESVGPIVPTFSRRNCFSASNINQITVGIQSRNKQQPPAKQTCPSDAAQSAQMVETAGQCHLPDAMHGIPGEASLVHLVVENDAQSLQRPNATTHSNNDQEDVAGHVLSEKHEGLHVPAHINNIATSPAASFVLQSGPRVKDAADLLRPLTPGQQQQIQLHSVDKQPLQQGNTNLKEPAADIAEALQWEIVIGNDNSHRPATLETGLARASNIGRITTSRSYQPEKAGALEPALSPRCQLETNDMQGALHLFPPNRIDNKTFSRNTVTTPTKCFRDPWRSAPVQAKVPIGITVSAAVTRKATPGLEADHLRHVSSPYKSNRCDHATALALQQAAEKAHARKHV